MQPRLKFNAFILIVDLSETYVVFVYSILTNFTYYCKLADETQRNDKKSATMRYLIATSNQ